MGRNEKITAEVERRYAGAEHVGVIKDQRLEVG